MWFERGCATSNLDSFAVWRDFVLPRTPDASVDEVSAACQCCECRCMRAQEWYGHDCAASSYQDGSPRRRLLHQKSVSVVL